MQSFLEEVVHEVHQKYPNLENLVFVLPSKRAGTFLKNCIGKVHRGPLFSPEIHSIESFVETIAKLQIATFSQQLFGLYEVYLKCGYPKKDDFYQFSKWGSVLLQDFNEVDRYLVDANTIFSNLADLQKLNHWSLETEKTPMIREYLRFWEGLGELYTYFNASLLEKGLAHQGLIYRQAHDLLEDYLTVNSGKTHIFIGFNALNLAELQIIQTILSSTDAHIYWDLDSCFLQDSIHDAGFFIRNHLKSWPYFRNNPIQGLSENYGSKKDIQIIGVPKSVGQAKYIGRILREIFHDNPKQLTRTAVVLGDEALLNPLLHGIPKEISTANITMGYPLDKTVMASLFSQLFELHIQKRKQGWYHRQVLDLLAHPSVQPLMESKSGNIAKLISTEIRRNNWSYVDFKKLVSVERSKQEVLGLLFPNNSLKPREFVKNSIVIIALLKECFQHSRENLSLEYLYHFHKLFNQMAELLDRYTFLKDLKALQSVYQELLSAETLDFQGEPLEGLQVMGMLESRNLDFETVLITSVNEGILPAGKSNNSFIPFDVKRYFGLPTYKEKDAVYTYHFYRLLQRAKQIYILYNTEPDVLEGGEPSRLIMQLLTDDRTKGNIVHKKVAPIIRASNKGLTVITKNEGLIKMIAQHAASGFSPSSLSNYIRNPLDFYKRNLLGIDESRDMEETVAANTFGTIVHDSLEELYLPFVGEYLSVDDLRNLKPRIAGAVRQNFHKNYPNSDYTRGKNLIAFNVIIKYISNFVDNEILEAKDHDIRIIALESKLETQINVPGVNYPVVLKGKLDRIDEKDGIVRIIDYKTGTTRPSQVEISDWSTIIKEYEHNKAFQLLCYALLHHSSYGMDKMIAGIISFKGLGSGLIPFALKENKYSRTKKTEISTEILNHFTLQLQSLISEIFDPEIPLKEKEV